MSDHCSETSLVMVVSHAGQALQLTTSHFDALLTYRCGLSLSGQPYFFGPIRTQTGWAEAKQTYAGQGAVSP